MASFRNRNGKWQALIQIQGHTTLSKTFINKVDTERWAKQVEVEIQKGSYTNIVLAERTIFTKIIERYIVEILPTMRGGKAERNAKSIMSRYLTDLGNHCNLFYKQIKTRDRPPSGYAQVGLEDPEQLVLAIIKTQLSK